MRIDYIDPFVNSTIEILSSTVSSDIKKGELILKSNIQTMLGLVLLVGLTGSATGRVVFDMSQELALKIASIMNEDNFTEFDEMVNATLTELSNMIVGNAVTKLHEIGFQFDLTPPAIFLGDNLRISDNKIESLIVPIEIFGDKILVNVALKEN